MLLRVGCSQRCALSAKSQRNRVCAGEDERQVGRPTAWREHPADTRHSKEPPTGGWVKETERGGGVKG